MTTELLPETGEPSGSSSPPQQPAPPDDRRGRWSGRAALAIGVICILIVGAVWLPDALSSPESGPELTHTISRGNLIISVTEQGTVESSNNTEVKCKVRGFSTVTWVIPAGEIVEPGDELVRLDTKVIEEQHSLTKTNTFIAKATLEESKANVAKSLIAIDAYSGRLARQLTLNESTAKDELTGDLLGALEQSAAEGAIVLEVEGVFLDDGESEKVSLQFDPGLKGDAYVRRNGDRAVFDRQALVALAGDGKFVGTFTARHKEGRYQQQMQEREKELAANERNLRAAQEMLGRSKKLFRQGYVTKQEVDGNAFTVKQAELELHVKQTEIKVLRDFTREMELETLQGNLTANQSKLAADEAGLAMETKRRDRAEEEFQDCVIRAEKGGLVIYPSAAAWKRTPDITEGATVRKDQVLLLMPDLTKMQVKVGIHESMIERVRPGLEALVTLSDRTLEAEVSSVASVTRPAGWWTGNVVKYDTIIELPPESGLKPGMTAEVEVVMAVHQDVLMIPVAAVLETEQGDYCWVKTQDAAEKRLLQLGDSNDVFIVVNGGLNEGDEVVLNPTAYVEEARADALNTQEDMPPAEQESSGAAAESGGDSSAKSN